MKCVKVLSTNSVERIKENEAHKLVSQGKAQYVSKAEWRKADPEYPAKHAAYVKAQAAAKAKKDKPVVEEPLK